MGTTFEEYVPDKLRDLANQVLKHEEVLFNIHKKQLLHSMPARIFS